MAAGLCPNHANAAADGEAGGRVWQGLLLRVNVRAFGVMQNLITIVRVIYAMATALWELATAAAAAAAKLLGGSRRRSHENRAREHWSCG
jgi:hypothetical protein